jgi:hypothetical protein
MRQGMCIWIYNTINKKKGKKGKREKGKKGKGE